MRAELQRGGQPCRARRIAQAQIALGQLGRDILAQKRQARPALPDQAFTCQPAAQPVIDPDGAVDLPSAVAAPDDHWLVPRGDPLNRFELIGLPDQQHPVEHA